MVEYRKATLDDIINDAQKYKRTKKLKEIAAQTYDGRRITFLQLKKAYYAEFYDELLPVAKPKITMWDRIAEL